MANNTAKGWEDINDEQDMTEEEGGGKGASITIAPEEPVQLKRDKETNKVTKVIYGNQERMLEGEAVVMWSEEILRDEETGKIIGVQTVRPNGSVTIEHILRDGDGKFTGTRLEYV